MTEAHFLLADLNDTEALAHKLAQSLPPHAVIGLVGNLGAGKTTLTQALARELGIRDHLPSPTFTLLNEHRVAGKLFVHGDFYRIEDEQAARELGVSDYTTTADLTVIEWADKFPSILPKDTIWITLTLRGDDRIAHIESPHAAFWRHFALEKLA